jgi:hypothetical protein
MTLPLEEELPGLGTFRLNRLDPVADLDLVYRWVTEPRAVFWGMTTHSPELVQEIYEFLDGLETHHAYLMHLADTPDRHLPDLRTGGRPDRRALPGPRGRFRHPPVPGTRGPTDPRLHRRDRRRPAPIRLRRPRRSADPGRAGRPERTGIGALAPPRLRFRQSGRDPGEDGPTRLLGPKLVADVSSLHCHAARARRVRLNANSPKLPAARSRLALPHPIWHKGDHLVRHCTRAPSLQGRTHRASRQPAARSFRSATG